MKEYHWLLFDCNSSSCIKNGNGAFAVRSQNDLKNAHCPVCKSVCETKIAWVADIDGTGGPNEPILPYVRSMAAKVRNEMFRLRTETHEASEKIQVQLEKIYSFVKVNTKKIVEEALSDKGD